MTMDKVYVMTFVEVKNGSLKNVTTEVAEDITILTNKMNKEYDTLRDFCNLGANTKITAEVGATNIEMYVNSATNFTHYSWNINTCYTL